MHATDQLEGVHQSGLAHPLPSRLPAPRHPDFRESQHARHGREHRLQQGQSVCGHVLQHVHGVHTQAEGLSRAGRAYVLPQQEVPHEPAGECVSAWCVQHVCFVPSELISTRNIVFVYAILQMKKSVGHGFSREWRAGWTDDGGELI